MKSALRILAKNLVFFLESEQTDRGKKQDLPKVDYWRTVAGRPVGFVGKVGSGVPITAGADLGASMRDSEAQSAGVSLDDMMRSNRAFRAEQRAAAQFRASLNKEIDSADKTPFGDAEYSDATKAAGVAMIERMNRLMPDNPFVETLSKALELSEAGKLKSRSQWVKHFTAGVPTFAGIKEMHLEYGKIFDAYFADIKKENRERYGDPVIKMDRDKEEATISYGALSVSVDLKNLMASNGSQRRIAESVSDFMVMNAPTIHAALTEKQVIEQTLVDCRNFLDSDLATAVRDQIKEFARADMQKRRDFLDSNKSRWILNPDRPPMRQGYWGEDSPKFALSDALRGKFSNDSEALPSGDFYAEFENLLKNYPNNYGVQLFKNLEQYREFRNDLMDIPHSGVTEDQMDEIFKKLVDYHEKKIDDVFDNWNEEISKIERQQSAGVSDPNAYNVLNSVGYGSVSRAINGAVYAYDILRGADSRKHKPRVVVGGLENVKIRNQSVLNVMVRLDKYRNPDGTTNRSKYTNLRSQNTIGSTIILCNKEGDLSFDPDRESVDWTMGGTPITSSGTSRVLHHELGHWLDDVVRIQTTAGIRFLSAIKNDHKKELPSMIYHKDNAKRKDFEMGLEDDLLIHYMGKIYEHSNATEANSMAAEYMAGKVASTTALQDGRAFKHMVLLAEAKHLDYARPKIDLSVDSKIIEKPKRGRPRKNK